MSIFDTSSVEAGHRRLASSLYKYTLTLEAIAALIDAALLKQNFVRPDVDEQASFLGLSQLGFRLVNDVGAAIRLLECGYFVQAAAFGRDLAEIGMLALYFAERPNDILEWTRLEGVDRYRKFGRSKLQIKISDKNRYDWFNQWFDLFSEYGIHPSGKSIVAHSDGITLHVGPHVNEALFCNTYRDLTELAWRAAQAGGFAYKSLFHADIVDVAPQEQANLDYAISALGWNW